jgi:hypothetical protein
MCAIARDFSSPCVNTGASKPLMVVKGEPNQARPQDCQMLARGRTILWAKGHKT